MSSISHSAADEIAIPIPEISEADWSPERQYNENQQTSQGINDTSESRRIACQSMYQAALKGNLKSAKEILNKDPSLAYEELPETGDRALHLAISGKHTDLAMFLIERIPAEMFLLTDKRGYTACCYAAMMGDVNVADMLIDKNIYVVVQRNMFGTTPVHLAFSHGAIEMAGLLILYAHYMIGITNEEWFRLLLIAVHGKMYVLASELLNSNPVLALVKGGGDGRTALHVLAQVDISGWKTEDVDDFRILSKSLLNIIQNKDAATVLELMTKPPILHDAAKVGNVELITMITSTYPDLLSNIDPTTKCSMFHVAVRHRHENMLELIKQARNTKTFSEIIQDDDGNNLLHDAGKLLRPKGLKIVAERDVQMQIAFSWFKAVETIVPPYFLEMKNNDGYTPVELFWEQHEKLLTMSETYMKSTSESCMLISTIILSLVFAAAFAPPGGFNQDTGIPVLLNKNWFACFIVFETLALFSSTYSIIGFWSIISSNYREDQFLILPHYLRNAMCILLLSVLFAISAFLSAFFLIFTEARKGLVLSFMLPLYVLLVAGVSYQLFKVLRKNNQLKYYSKMGATTPNNDNLDNLNSFWRRVYNSSAAIFFFFCSCF